MNTSLFHRLRAERFADLIEQEAQGRRGTPAAMDPELGRLVSLTKRVSDLPMSVESDPAFREGLRAVLMATIEREGIGATAEPETASSSTSRREARAAAAEHRQARRRTRIFGAVVAGLAATALGLSGVSVASGTALPGQALYSVKRQTERAQIVFTGSDTEKGQLYLSFAMTRLDEAKAVVDDPSTFASILDDMDDETRDGVRHLVQAAIDRKDAAALHAIDTFVEDQRRNLTRLIDSLTGRNKQRATASGNLIDQVRDRSAAVRSVLPCQSDIVAGVDGLGPVPVAQCDGQAGAEKKQTSPGAGEKPAARETSGSGGKSGAPQQPTAQTGGSSVVGEPSAPSTLDGTTLNGDRGDVLGGIPN